MLFAWSAHTISLAGGVNQMDMQWLDDVLVLLEEGNMTRAAARRNITQPAFSRRIRSFEDWLGVQVLDRGTNRIGISPALVSNESEIRALVARIRELRTQIVHFDPANSTISIAAQHAPVFSTFPDMALRAKRFLPAVLARRHQYVAVLRVGRGRILAVWRECPACLVGCRLPDTGCGGTAALYG